jgi:cell wall-associated NlpC family hydrolase
MANNGLKAPAVFAAGAGALVLYSGMKGVSVLGGLKSLITGKQPSGTNVYPLQSAGGNAANPLAGGTSGNAIADDGLKYVGSGSVYLWGGGSPRGWDCSGFCNYVIGHDLGMSIPGIRGGFNGSSHGPVTSQWAIWNGAQTIPRNQVQAGDLCIWPLFHMGIAISNTQMVNCPGPNGSANPVIGNIDGGGTGILVCRRITGTVTQTPFHRSAQGGG